MEKEIEELKKEIERLKRLIEINTTDIKILKEGGNI